MSASIAASLMVFFPRESSAMATRRSSAVSEVSLSLDQMWLRTTPTAAVPTLLSLSLSEARAGIKARLSPMASSVRRIAERTVLTCVLRNSIKRRSTARGPIIASLAIAVSRCIEEPLSRSVRSRPISLAADALITIGANLGFVLQVKIQPLDFEYRGYS